MMQIELGLIGAFALMGMAVQLRILKILQIKMREIKREQKQRDEELEAQATARFASTAKDLEEWEKLHGKRGSSSPFLKDADINSPDTEDTSLTLPYGSERRQRYQSGVSDFIAAPAPLQDEFGRPMDRRQSIGALPAMDLGLDIEKSIPRGFVDEETGKSTPPQTHTTSPPQETGDLKRKEELLAEIQSIRKSIEVLRATTPSSSRSESRERHQSFTSRRTLSQDLSKVFEAPVRPPRATDPRARISSLEMLRTNSGGESSRSRSQDAASIGRPNSAPLQEQEWDAYVRERKLFQPPSGVTAPIAPGTVAPQPKRPLAVPHYVSEALLRRHQQEHAIEVGEFGQADSQEQTSAQGSSSEGRQSNTVNVRASRVPVNILPPRKPDPTPTTKPSAPKTRTFEELNERHRQMMRDLQAPLSRAERERAEVEAARQRWERSKTLEKQAMAKREAEKMAAAKDKKQKGGKGESSSHPDRKTDKNQARRQSQSADLLVAQQGTVGSTSKRQSTMKVEDWRRYQHETPGASSSRRDSNVPFPGASRDTHRSPGEGHHSTRRKA